MNSDRRDNESGSGSGSDSDAPVNKRRRVNRSNKEITNAHLETINRKKLDFDFEKVCSVSLSNNNVYCCLTCGKYFQGRGKSSFAYLHSVDYDHNVFINLESLKVYALPEGYEIQNSTLDDIKNVVNPVYTKEQVMKLDKQQIESVDLWRKKYVPGFVGLNNLKNCDYANVIFQAIAHVPPLRNYLMLENFEQKNELAKKVSLLIRKMWNGAAFKPHVSPQEVMECISTMSKKKYSTMEQKDPFMFMNWFLNQLHLAVGGSKSKPRSSIVQKCFQGTLELEVSGENNKVINFMFLSLELPPMPLFKDDDEEKSIPQVSLNELLAKTNYKLESLPRYFTIHYKRFKPDIERNVTVVSYNPLLLQVGDEKYRLLANIVIDSTSSSKLTYKIQLLDKSRNIYTQIQDLEIQTVQSELLVLNETYIQIWERVLV